MKRMGTPLTWEQLANREAHKMSVCSKTNLGVMIDPLFAVQIQGVLAREARVFSIKLIELGV